MSSALQLFFLGDTQNSAPSTSKLSFCSKTKQNKIKQNKIKIKLKLKQNKYKIKIK